METEIIVMKYYLLISTVFFILIMLATCGRNENVKPQQITVSKFDELSLAPNGNFIETEGWFDLKVACLNLASKPRVNENICETPLVKNNEANSESKWVILKVCDKQTKSNCIEPLPDNAPPEVIHIRDKDSKILEPWSKVKIKLKSWQTNNKQNRKPLVILIESPDS
jgi:hypothetical protein